MPRRENEEGNSTFSISREQSRTYSGFTEAGKRRKKFNESDKPRTIKLIDTHSHLYEPEFDDDCEAAVARAREAGVALTDRLRADGYQIVGEPRTTGDGYFESVVADPDGNLVEITC